MLFNTNLVIAAGIALLTSSVHGQNTNLQTVFPKPSSTTNLAAVRTILAGQTFDGGMKQWDRSPSTCSDQAEGGDADAVFLLENGATLSNVIVGPNNGEGIHCKGTCTLNNVWWSDVCEDAATFKQSSGTSYVNGGGARSASDKVFQHNGAGTVNIKNFFAQNIGKLYRSCGNCGTQYARTVNINNVRVEGGKVGAGVNGNLGDKATVTNSCFTSGEVCALYSGVTSGEPKQTGSAPDGKTCVATGVRTGNC